jgi:ParB-like chromosome segregation protein Spo0J
VDLEDRNCYIPCFDDVELLAESIERIGIVNPPLVQKRSDGSIICVLGRRRLQAAINAGISAVDVRLLPEDVPESEAFLLSFWDNLGHRSFDRACAAVVVRRLLELFPRDKVASDFLPLLGVEATGPRLERLRALGGLDDCLLKALASGRILEKTAVTLARLDPEERSALMDLTESLGLNANKSAEVIDHLFDLSILHRKSVLAWVRDNQVQTILQDESLSRPERAERLRQLVRAWKFPALVEKEKQFRKWLAGIPRAGGIVVRPTPAFEDERCVIEVAVESRVQAERILARIGDDLA